VPTPARSSGAIDVSVIIPARDAAPTLERTLRALEAQKLDRGFEVIVVDDGSRDETAAIARRYDGLVRLIRNEDSRGPGAARNRGAEEARGPMLAFTDADCFPTPGWLAHGLDALAHADLVQGRVEPDPTAQRTPFDRTLSVESDSGFYQTANLFARRETFEALGGFRDWVLEARPDRRWSQDTRRGRAARTPIGEDTDFAWRARRLSAVVGFSTDALVHHAVVPGTVSDAMADRWHWSRDMAGMTRLVPELRRTAYYRRVFFNQVSARFDLALAGLAIAMITREAGWTVAGMPYIRHLRAVSSQWGRAEAITYILGAPLVDAVTMAGLITGSLTWRSLVL
jgi:glycosyltransferase involved in cell wall biosynthesis